MGSGELRNNIYSKAPRRIRTQRSKKGKCGKWGQVMVDMGFPCLRTLDKWHFKYVEGWDKRELIRLSEDILGSHI